MTDSSWSWIRRRQWVRRIGSRMFRRRRGRRRAHGSKNARSRTSTTSAPQWLKLAHEKLDGAVYAATAPGQPLPRNHALAAERQGGDQAVLANLLQLNRERVNEV